VRRPRASRERTTSTSGDWIRSREFLYVETPRGIILAAERYDGPSPSTSGGRGDHDRELVALIVQLTASKARCAGIRRSPTDSRAARSTRAALESASGSRPPRLRGRAAAHDRLYDTTQRREATSACHRELNELPQPLPWSLSRAGRARRSHARPSPPPDTSVLGDLRKTRNGRPWRTQKLRRAGQRRCHDQHRGSRSEGRIVSNSAISCSIGDRCRG